MVKSMLARRNRTLSLTLIQVMAFETILKTHFATGDILRVQICNQIVGSDSDGPADISADSGMIRMHHFVQLKHVLVGGHRYDLSYGDG